MTSRALETVLVANRGEIAVRIIRACHRLGLRTAAVYSDADRRSPHVELADTALRLGPAPPRESYLNTRAVLEVADRAGADAVHPGYGFLAENAAFARACGEAGLIFIGPHAGAIETMGAKTTAKAVAADAGVPTVPGYHGGAQDDATLSAEAERIGWPLLIKASAGGGGRGMRRVDSPQSLARELELARAEAEAAFGDPTVLLERFVPRARHLEVQVLGDRHGNVVHLLDRDCSLQRHHQKLIEEAPAPALPDGLCGDLRRRAVDLARAIGYDNAGTVEFVHDTERGEAWFLEMNTRLQVEHPVTEAITGVDLVAWQIRIAAGEALDFGQADVGADGWAIEARVAAEDPANGYAPQTGTLSHWRAPAGPGLRVDSGVVTGTVVGHHYDSMLAKLIAHGHDREAARRRLRRALADLEAGGVGLNTPFLRELLDLPGFAAGRPHTALIDETWPEGWRATQAASRELIEAVLAAHLTSAQSGNEGGTWSALGPWRITGAAGRPGSAIHYVTAADGALRRVRLIQSGDRISAELEGEPPMELSGVALAEGRLTYEQADRVHATRVLADGDSVTLFRPEGALAVRVLAPEDALLGAPEADSGQGSIVAPMPGAIVEVRVEAGQAVRAGETLCVLEAMKLFQELTAPFDGTVGELRHEVGDNIAGGELLAVVIPTMSTDGDGTNERANHD